MAVGSAVAAGESISARDVGLFRVVKHTYNRLNRLAFSAGGRDTGREGQGLQSCMRCKCSAKQNWLVLYQARN